MSIFTKIADGEIPSYKVAADDRHYAFLDINPVAPGHTLVIPRREVDYLFDLSEQEYADLMEFARKVALAMKEVMPCRKVGMAVLGLEVPHAHVHLVPITKESDMNFFKEKLSLDSKDMAEIAEKINKKFSEINN